MSERRKKEKRHWKGRYGLRACPPWMERRDELHSQDAMTKRGKIPTTTKWVDGVKKADDGRDFERCRSVAGKFNPTRSIYEQLVAAMPPLEAKEALPAFNAGYVKEDD